MSFGFTVVSADDELTTSWVRELVVEFKGVQYAVEFSCDSDEGLSWWSPCDLPKKLRKKLDEMDMLDWFELDSAPVSQPVTSSGAFSFDIVQVFEDDVDAWTRPFDVTFDGAEYDLYLSYDPQVGYSWYTHSDCLPQVLRDDLDTMDLGALDSATWHHRDAKPVVS